ncbi:MAG TPA: chemotaxis protein CheW [Candidatus Binatus sp.]|nr:chemotaxis protein CheW [Candidatus Binatus sp.]
MDDALTNDQSQYLTFHLAGEEYAVAILKVKEIIEYGTLTVVPQTPPSIRGVINLRGNVVPVVDLALRFGVPQSPITNRTCIIIVEVDFGAEPAVMGIIADSVSQVVEFAPSEILAPPSFGTRVKVDFLQGMGKSDKKFSLILNIDKVLSIDEIKVTSPTQRARLERTLKMELSE